MEKAETRHTFVSEIASRYGRRLRRFFTLRLRNNTDVEVFAELQLRSDDDPMVRADAQQRLDEVEYVLAQLPPKVSTTLLLHRFAG